MEENRIRELRKARHLSGEELARAAGTSVQQIYRLETGARRLTIEWVRKLAEALKCNEYELLSAVKGPETTCPVIGFVTDQETVRLYHKKKKTAPVPLSGVGVSALEVLTVSLRPRYDEGDLLYFEQPPATQALQACVGQECVLELQDGSMVLRTVLDMGGERAVRTCTFGSYKAEEMAVRWAAPIRWVLRGEGLAET